MRRNSLLLALAVSLLFYPLDALALSQNVGATSGSNVLLTTYTQTVSWGDTIFTNQVTVYPTYVNLTASSLGAASATQQTFGIGAQYASATITNIDSADVVLTTTSGTQTNLLWFYYTSVPYNVQLVQGSSTATIYSSQFNPDQTTFNGLTPPAVYQNIASKYIEVSIPSGSASTLTVNFSGLSYDPKTGGGAISLITTSTAISPPITPIDLSAASFLIPLVLVGVIGSFAYLRLKKKPITKLLNQVGFNDDIRLPDSKLNEE